MGIMPLEVSTDNVTAKQQNKKTFSLYQLVCSVDILNAPSKSKLVFLFQIQTQESVLRVCIN